MNTVEKQPRIGVAWAFILLRLVEGSGISPIYVFLPNTIADFFASESSHETMHCSDFDKDHMPDACLDAHSKAMLVAAIKDFICFGILSFFLNPLFGAWSDVYGRKPFLVLNALGFMIPKLFVYFYARWGLSLYGFFIVAVVVTALQNQGILFAFIADVVPVESKNFYFALLFAAENLGVLVGSGLVVSGLVGSVQTAALLGSFSNAAAILVIVFILPETALLSHKTDTRAKVSFFDVMSILTQNRIFMCLTACVVAASAALMDGSGEIFGQYLLEVSGLTTKDIAIAAAIVCVSALCSPAIVYLLTSVMSLSHTNVLMVCFSALFVEFCMLAFAVVKSVTFAALAFAVFIIIALTTASAAMSDMVPDDQEGAVQGSITAVRSAVAGIFPLIFLGVFAACRTDAFYFPGAAMLMIAGVQLIGFFASRRSGWYLSLSLFNQDVEMPATVMYTPVDKDEVESQ